MLSSGSAIGLVQPVTRVITTSAALTGPDWLNVILISFPPFPDQTDILSERHIRQAKCRGDIVS